MKLAYWVHRPEDGGSKHLWNVGKRLPDNTAQHLHLPSCFTRWNGFRSSYFSPLPFKHSVNLFFGIITFIILSAMSYPPLKPILNHFSVVYSFVTCFCDSHFNIILNSAPFLSQMIPFLEISCSKFWLHLFRHVYYLNCTFYLSDFECLLSSWNLWKYIFSSNFRSGPVSSFILSLIGPKLTWSSLCRSDFLT
jgi:hypothetical protein